MNYKKEILQHVKQFENSNKDVKIQVHDYMMLDLSVLKQKVASNKNFKLFISIGNYGNETDEDAAKQHFDKQKWAFIEGITLIIFINDLSDMFKFDAYNTVVIVECQFIAHFMHTVHH